MQSYTPRSEGRAAGAHRRGRVAEQSARSRPGARQSCGTRWACMQTCGDCMLCEVVLGQAGCWRRKWSAVEQRWRSGGARGRAIRPAPTAHTCPVHSTAAYEVCSSPTSCCGFGCTSRGQTAPTPLAQRLNSCSLADHCVRQRAQAIISNVSQLMDGYAWPVDSRVQSGTVVACTIARWQFVSLTHDGSKAYEQPGGCVEAPSSPRMQLGTTYSFSLCSQCTEYYSPKKDNEASMTTAKKKKKKKKTSQARFELARSGPRPRHDNEAHPNVGSISSDHCSTGPSSTKEKNFAHHLTTKAATPRNKLT